MDVKKLLFAKCDSIKRHRAHKRGYTHAVVQIYVKWNYLWPLSIVLLYMKEIICALKGLLSSGIIDNRPYNSIAIMLWYVRQGMQLQIRVALLPGGHVSELAVDNNSALRFPFSAFQQQHVFFPLLIRGLIGILA